MNNKTLQKSLLAILIFFLILFIISPSENFRKGNIVFIEKGESLNAIATELKENGIIRSKIVFNTLIVFLNADTKIQSGDYVFNSAPNLFSVIGRLIGGKYGVDSVKITLTEGMTVYEMSEELSKQLPQFSSEEFLKQAKEGYLFPDTYNFYLTANTSEVLDMLTRTFNSKTKKLRDEATTKKKNFDDIIILASIIEKEATKDSRAIISGILQKRITLGMPLQVDASLTYILNKTSAELTTSDLKNKSPYNTYTHQGLTPTPISNPGIESIKAALNPTSTPYIYFLTGKDGKMYYARTLEEHVRNKAKYL